MKLNRQKLRKIILQEMKHVQEAGATGLTPALLMKQLRETGVQGSISLSPAGAAITMHNFWDDISSAFESGGLDDAARVFWKHHEQLMRDTDNVLLNQIFQIVDNT